MNTFLAVYSQAEATLQVPHLRFKLLVTVKKMVVKDFFWDDSITSYFAFHFHKFNISPPSIAHTIFLFDGFVFASDVRPQVGCF